MTVDNCLWGWCVGSGRVVCASPARRSHVTVPHPQSHPLPAPRGPKRCKVVCGSDELSVRYSKPRCCKRFDHARIRFPLSYLPRAISKAIRSRYGRNRPSPLELTLYPHYCTDSALYVGDLKHIGAVTFATLVEDHSSHQCPSLRGSIPSNQPQKSPILHHHTNARSMTLS